MLVHADLVVGVYHHVDEVGEYELFFCVEFDVVRGYGFYLYLVGVHI